MDAAASIPAAWRARDRLLRSLRDRRGVSALEFAMILPVLIVLLLGAFDLGNAFQQGIRLEAAARAAAQAAFSDPSVNSNGKLPKVETLVRDNLPNDWNDLEVSAWVRVYKCDNPNTPDVEVQAPTAPPSGCSTPKAILITVSRPFTFVGPLTQYMLPFLSPVRGNVEVRLM